jgi:hypothetical protein
MQHVSCRGYIGKTLNSQAEGNRFESGHRQSIFSNFQSQIFFLIFYLFSNTEYIFMAAVDKTIHVVLRRRIAAVHHFTSDARQSPVLDC